LFFSIFNFLLPSSFFLFFLSFHPFIMARRKSKPTQKTATSTPVVPPTLFQKVLFSLFSFLSFSFIHLFNRSSFLRFVQFCDYLVFIFLPWVYFSREVCHLRDKADLHEKTQSETNGRITLLQRRLDQLLARKVSILPSFLF